MIRESKTKKWIIYGLFTSILFCSFDNWFRNNLLGSIITSIIGNFDEAWVLAFFLYALLGLKRKKRNNVFLYFMILWASTGVIGNYVKQTSTTNAVLGCYVSLKPFLLFWSLCQFDFSWHDFYRLMKMFSFFFFCILTTYILDFFFGNFRPLLGIKENGERIGWRSLGGIFYLQTTGVLWGVIYYIYYKYYGRNEENYKAYLGGLFVFTALKAKDILGFTMGLFVGLFKQIRIYHAALASIVVFGMFTAYSIYMPEHYSRYFEQGDDSDIARVALTVTSLKIAKDHFPFGVGFGQYGSPISMQYESNVYADYGINNVWGLNYDDNNRFMCDTFWPMILGETGCLGTLTYIFILFIAFWPFLSIYLNNTQNRNVIFPSVLFIIFIFMSIGKQVLIGPPHYLALWGIAGIFYSLKEERYSYQ